MKSCGDGKNKERKNMYLGIDFGGINIAIGLVDEKGKILFKDSVPTGRLRQADEIIADMAALCKSVTERAGYKMSDVKAIGIGSPGTPDIKEKRIVYANNIANFTNVYIEKELQKYFPNMPVYLENDANAAAFGEIVAGAAKNLKTAVIITLGTGIGGGVIIDNKIYAGFNHAGAEIGHIVINFEGEMCSCGRRGCFEAYASATALIEQTKRKMREAPESLMHEIAKSEDEVNGRTPFDAAARGDKAAKEVIDQYIEYLGIGISDVVNIFQPEAVVLSGGISKQGENLLVPLRKYVSEHTYGAGMGIPVPQIIQAELGNDAGIVGAAMLWTQNE